MTGINIKEHRLHLNTHTLVIVHVVKYSAQISQLRQPLIVLIETEVVAKYEQYVIMLKKLGFTTQLIEQIICPQCKTTTVHKLKSHNC